ncbi:MAG: hypothetical protein AAGJ82_15640, partial [Bacteroidota bacterium]
MKKRTIYTITGLLALVLCLCLSSRLLSQCNCTEYLYINEETNGGVVHKFSINPSDGTLTEILTPGGDPWNESAD